MEPTTQFKQCPRCKQPAPLHAPQCAACGRQFRTQFGAEQYERTVVYNNPAPAEPAPMPARYEAVIEHPAYPPQPTPYYRAPQQPQHTPPQQSTDICATLSVIFGAVSLALFCFFGWAFAVTSIALGVVALTRIRHNPYLGGQALAITGIALSVPAFLFGTYFLYLWLVAVATTPSSSAH